MNEFTRTRGYDKTKSLSIVKGTEATLLSEKVPSSTSLLVTHFANDVGDLGAWTDAGGVTWYIKINGTVVMEVKDQLGNTSQPRELGEPIEVRGGDLFEITGKNPSAATDYAMLVSLKGYYGYRRS